MKRILKGAIVLAIVPLVLLLALEIIFRFLEVAWPPIYQTIFDDKNKYYIYMLGESTSEGVQYQEKISPAILVSYQFHDSLKGKSIEIISLAQSAQTIEFNYFKFYFELLFRPHKNGLVLLYSGINENTNNVADNEFKAWERIQHSVVLSKLCYMADRYPNSPAKYEYRYHQTIGLAKKHGYKMVISQLVGNFAEYEPEIFKTDDLMQPGKIEILHAAKKEFNEGRYDSAEILYRYLADSLNYEHAFLLYHIGRCKFAKGEYDSAAVYLRRAPEINIYIGYADWKNKIIAKVASEEHIPVAPTCDRFIDSSEHGLIGYNLINDAHHPNLKGYSIMANLLTKEVSELYSEPIKRQPLTPDNIAHDFKFDSTFYSGVYFRLTEWFIFEVFETQEREIRLSRLKFYLNKFESYAPGDEISVLWHLIVALQEKNEKDFFTWLHRMSTCQRKKELLERFQAVFKIKQYDAEVVETIKSWKPANASEAKMVDELLKYAN